MAIFSLASPESVRLAELWARLRAAGFVDALGFGPENVRLHVDAIRMLVREELRLFARGITGKVGADDAVRMADEGIALLGEILGILHRQILLRFIAEGNVPVDEQARDESSTAS